MPRIELTIKHDYVDWGLAEGLRELLQNARDAGIETGTPPTVKYDASTKTLRLVNKGADLSRDALLLGYSSKRDRADLAGQFGEGLKLGTLGILNAGRTIGFKTPTELWHPAIEGSRQFPGQQVLAFHVSKRRRERDDGAASVTVTVHGIEPAEWADVKARTLWLSPVRDRYLNEFNGSILFDPEQAGRVYVKGLFVELQPGLRYGYDLLNVQTDRDRKMVNRSAAEYAFLTLWARCLEAHPERARDFYALLAAQAPDVARYDWFSFDAVGDKFVEQFVAKHGPDAVVLTSDEDRAADALGVEPSDRIVVTAALKRALTQAKTLRARTLDAVSSELTGRRPPILGNADLTREQYDTWSDALRLLFRAVPAAQQLHFDIVESFPDDARGRAYDGGVILVARAELATVHQCVRVLAHEAAHGLAGLHHGASQQYAAEEILGAVVRDLLADLHRVTNTRPAQDVGPGRDWPSA